MNLGKPVRKDIFEPEPIPVEAWPKPIRVVPMPMPEKVPVKRVAVIKQLMEVTLC